MKVISVSLIRRPLFAVTAALRWLHRRRKAAPAPARPAIPPAAPAAPVTVPARAPSKAAYRANSAAHRLSTHPSPARRSPVMH
ncbi:hypothetical protein [Actinoplanes philippinensis]|uniref:hypothetical protein n=1 Tax=Actinoplanes philippinensis TaxID=35752 RepID=UPI00340C16D4